MTFRWEITILERNHYGDKIVNRTPASVLGKDRAEVTDKVRIIMNAEYDSFRGFWSHTWAFISVKEEADAEPSAVPGETADQSEGSRVNA